MLKTRFWSRRAKAYEDIHHLCTVEFLDDTTEPLSVTYQRDTKGKFLLDHVCQSLDLLENDYFGLRYQNADKERCWLDPTKSIQAQVKGILNPVFSFRVKFYPSEPLKVKEEITRYQLFLQLKRDLDRGRLLCTLEDALLFSAYIVQAELGDYDPDEHLPNYISEIKLPAAVKGHEKEISSIHKTLDGQTPAEAEANFLKKAAELDAYGLDPYIVTDMKGATIYLAITHQGVATFQNSKRTNVLKWQQIKRLTFEGRMFYVRLFTIDNDNSSLIMKRKISCHVQCSTIVIYLKHIQASQRCGSCGTSPLHHLVCGFKCATSTASKQLWKHAVSQQCFFSLQSSAEAPKVVSSGGLFHRNSKFRFSGRCQEEVYKSTADITRTEPKFVRSPSNTEFAQTYRNMKSMTLPPNWRQNNLLKDEQIAVLETTFEDSLLLPTNLNLDESKDEIRDPDSAVEPDRSSKGSSSSSEVEPSENISEVASGLETAVEGTDTNETPEVAPEDPQEEAIPKDSAAEVVSNLHLKLDAKIEELQAKLGLSKQQSSDNEEHENPSPEGEVEVTHNKEPATEGIDLDSGVPGTAIVEPKPDKPDRPNTPSKERKSYRICYKMAVSLLFVLSLILVVGLLVLESRLDFPVVSHLRVMPTVEEFRTYQYIPMRDAFLGMVNEYLGV